ncbi:MAG: hypothetical protein Q8O42_02520 [Acidobacteriota bacterium]|nr:hypothetical protein [Acidobacteriota bacterium]
MTAPLRWTIVLALVVAWLGTTAAQTPSTGRVMRDKLTHTQKILEAIMVSDYEALDRESAALVRATELPAWSVLKSPEYLRQSAAFPSAIQDLRDAAGARDLDRATLEYMSLTLTCFQCHKHLKGLRVAVK